MIQFVSIKLSLTGNSGLIENIILQDNYAEKVVIKAALLCNYLPW